MSEADREKWNARYREQSSVKTEAAALLVSAAERLPASGRVLDVAGGTGRNAIWLARRGLDVTLVDISEVALEIARREAAKVDAPLHTIEADLEFDAFPPGPWDVIVSIKYLQRRLFDVFAQSLAPGGLLIYAQPTRSNLLRHPKPGTRFLLEDGELPSLIGDLEVLDYHEGWQEEGRHEAQLIARRRE